MKEHMELETGTRPRTNAPDKSIKRAALIVATLSAFLIPFTGSSVNIALPQISSEFNSDAVLLSWIPTAFFLTAAMFLVPLGRIADLKGRKLVFLAGIIIFTIGSLLSAVSNSVEMLILCRGVQGIGAAMIFGTGLAILTSVYPLGERGKVLGINVASVYIGLSAGPFLGGFLTQNLGWRSVFFINVPLGILIVILGIWKLKGKWAEAKGESFDSIGSIIYGVMLVLIIYGVTNFQTGYLLILAGFILLFLFVVWENRVEHPILDIRLFRQNMVFSLSNFAALLNYSATFAITFLMSLYLQYIKDFSPQDAGLILVSQPIVMAVFSPFAGWLSDKAEPRVVASTGMGLLTIGLFIFSNISSNTSITLIIGNLAFLGFGFALFSSPNTNAIMSSVESRYLGIASATLGTMRLIGQVVSMAIVMLIFSLYLGREAISLDLYPLLVTSIRLVFSIFTGLSFLGIFASLGRGKLRPG